MGMTWVIWSIYKPLSSWGSGNIGLIYAYDGLQYLIIARHVLILTTIDIYCLIFH